MTGHLTTAGRLLDDLVDGTLAFQADLLRRTAGEMARVLDQAAQRDVEGAQEWRKPEIRRMTT